jgi:Fe-S-cluster containining protein
MVLYPCKEKDCGWCCDPVKVKAGFPMSQIPKDKNGKEIWEKKPEMRIPEAHPDTIRLDIFECLNYNKEEKKCDDYENRPDICRN